MFGKVYDIKDEIVFMNEPITGDDWMLKVDGKRNGLGFWKGLFLALFCGMLFVLIALPAEAAIVDSGTCGENLTWTLDDTGTLTINGAGRMTDFNYDSFAPWHSRRSSIKSIVIVSNVTSIGNYAFYDCSDLTSITIPNSVTSIGDSAFFRCSSLTNITLPNCVNSIGIAAFVYCKSLNSITIPYGVTSINGAVFHGCRSLDSITIPNSVTCIGEFAFKGSGLKNITIPNSVKSIGEEAFADCVSLTSIIIPNSVISISSYAFPYCSSLTSVTVSDENINYCSVDGVLFNKSKTILISYPAGKTSRTYSIPDGVIGIGEGAFMGCSGLNSVIIPNCVTSIGNQSFFYCSNLSSITIPNSVTSIGDSAFSGCDNLKTVQYYGTSEQWRNISIGSWNENLLLRAADNSGYTYIVKIGSCGDNLTWMLDSAETLTISGTGAMYDYDQLSEIPWYSQITMIKRVIIYNGVTSIGEGAFYECSSMTRVSIPDSVTSIGMGAFISCDSLTSITIPHSVISIGMGAFTGCSSLTNVYYTGSVVQWNNIIIDENNDDLLLANVSFAVKYVENEIASGVSFSKSFTWKLNENGQLIITGSGDMADCFNPDEAYIPEIKELCIQEGITSIPNYAFLDIINLTYVTIPNSVTSIGMGAFARCNSLEKIMIPESVSDIGDNPFSSNVKIYCYEYSYAQFWAEDNGYTVVLLDDDSINSFVTVTLPETKTVMAGSACSMGETIFPIMDNMIVSWTTSAPDVAEISPDGFLTAWKAGTTTITLSAGGKTAQCLVTVVQGAESFDIEDDIYVATTKAIQVSLFNIIPSDATVNLTWATDNTVYATVSQSGLVTGKAVGETMLTVTDAISGLTRMATIHICYPVKTISLNLADTSVYAGLPTNATALVTTTKGQSYENKLVTFSSSDPSVATVDQKGNIQTIKAGTVTITATAANGVTASKTLTVEAIQHILSLPVHLGEIESEAFAGLTAVEAVRIPEDVYYIADDAFAGSDVIILTPENSYAAQWAKDHGMTVIEESSR